MAKPDVPAIRAAIPLSKLAARPRDPLLGCNVCGEPSGEFKLYREGDERDRPIPGDAARVYIAVDHAECLKKLEQHPRLYTDERGVPGALPLLFGPCTRRRGTTCTSPKLKANGGDGLKINFFGFNGFICGRGGCRSTVGDAASCEDQQLVDLAPPDLVVDLREEMPEKASFGEVA